MLKIILAYIGLTSFVAVVVLLNVTSPASAGPIGILAIFLFTYLTSLGVITYAIYWIGRSIKKISGIFVPRKPFKNISFKQSYYFSSVIATIPVLLIGLQSVGSVGTYEIVLVGVFVFLGCLYISKIIR